MANVMIKNVQKIFGTVTVLRNICVDIADGEFMVLVGPSGCGKSTLLRMIAGLEDITDGTISIDDKVVNKLPPKQRDISMVFQNYALYPHMTVAQNMAFSLTLAKTDKREKDKTVAQAADILGLTPLLGRYPRQLSGGQRQRVAMGRAIVRNPKVFLFDEPLSNLDAKMRVEMRKEILDLHTRLNTTMIYVTHDQVEAMTLGDRICVMHGGILQQIGTPAEVFDDPANLFVAGFIGSPPMNLLPGSILRSGEKLIFQGNGFSAEIPQEMHSLLAEHIDMAITLGLRAKSFILSDTESSAPNTWSCKKEVVEMLGEDALLHLSLGDCKIIINTEPHALDNIKKTARISPMMHRAHFFSSKTEVNLTSGLNLPGRRSVRR